MKRQVLLVVAAAMMVVTGAALAAQAKAASTLTGKWMIKMADGPHGPMEMPLALTQEGTQVTAMLTPPGGGSDIKLTGEFVKGELTLSVSATDTTMGIRMKATLKPDGTLAGFTSSDMGDSTWTAARVK